VFEVAAGTGRPRFVVFELLKRLPEGELGFDEVKDRIRDGLGQQLAIKHHLDLLRRTTYVDVPFLAAVPDSRSRYGDPRGIGPEVIEKSAGLGPLDADLVFLGSGERGAAPSDAPAGPAPRSCSRNRRGGSLGKR